LHTIVNISVIKLLLVLEKIWDRSLIKQGEIQHPEHVEGASSKLAVMLYNSHEAICDDGDVNLYSHRILGIAPEGLHPEMLLYPTEKKLHLPSLLVEHGYILGLELKVVGQESESSLQFRRVIDNPAQIDGILFSVLIASKADSLIKKHVISIVLELRSVNNLVLEAGLLPDNEVGAYCRDCIEPGQVIVSLVKDIEGVRLVRYLIHGIDVMYLGFSYMYVLGYLRNHVKQRMDLYATLGLAESGPLIEAQAQVYSSGVKSVEPSVKDKLTVYPLALGKGGHIVSEFLVKPVVPVGVGVFQSTSGYNAFAESEMVTLLLMGCNDAGQFPEAVAPGQLSEHHQQELVPARHCLGPLVCIVSLYHLVELFLWQKLHELTEYVFSAVHMCLSRLQAAMIRNQFKSFSPIPASNLLYINN